jgi:DNA polymerase
MPIFHPSYLLRNQSKEPGSPKAQMWDDIREVRKKYDELTAK